MTDVPRSPARGTQRHFAAAHADVRNLVELRRVVGNASAALGAWGYRSAVKPRLPIQSLLCSSPTPKLSDVALRTFHLLAAGTCGRR